MSTRMVGRTLVILSMVGLGVSVLAGGPSWIQLALLALLAMGLFAYALTPAARDPGIDDLRTAIEELEALAGVPERAEPEGPARNPSLAGAQRIRASSTRVRALLDDAAAHDRTLRALLEGVGEPLLATDAAGRIILCNAAAQDLLSLRADNHLGRPVEEAFTQPELIGAVQSAREGSPVREEVRIARPDGPRIWETIAVPYGEPAPLRAIVLTFRDVTERSLSFQVRTDFVANASHELRTPVSAIRMAVETLEGLGPGDQAMRTKLVGMIASHTQRLEELIRDLLDLTRLESADARVAAEAVPASSLVQVLSPMFEAVCRDRSLTLRFDFAPELEAMRTDRNLLLLILGNLVDNSCKFAFAGSEVVIAGRRGETRGSARFEVIDRGVGIPLGQQQRIFERFFQVDAARTGHVRRGTGLGLSIVKHAVRRLGGSIRVNSVWQRGTTMTVEIPNCLDAAPVATGSGGHRLPQDR